MTETIFGMKECFPISQGQEMKDMKAAIIQEYIVLYLQVASICRGIALKAYGRSYSDRTYYQWSLSPQNLSFLDVPCGLKKSANFWRLLNFVWQTFEFKFDIFPVLFLAGFAAIVVNFSS